MRRQHAVPFSGPFPLYPVLMKRCVFMLRQLSPGSIFKDSHDTYFLITLQESK
uniref:Uncharacterized protein n=1 Tax=Cyclopterus lumpus TaxID=8103 RepID=A0A8C2WPV7_CYCLU